MTIQTVLFFLKNHLQNIIKISRTTIRAIVFLLRFTPRWFIIIIIIIFFHNNKLLEIRNLRTEIDKIHLVFFLVMYATISDYFHKAHYVDYSNEDKKNLFDNDIFVPCNQTAGLFI